MLLHGIYCLLQRILAKDRAKIALQALPLGKSFPSAAVESSVCTLQTEGVQNKY